jgi:hypothetical protein
VQRHALGAEEQFACAQQERIVAGIERVAQDDVHKLIEEDVWDLRSGAHDVEVGRLQRAMAHETVAERDHHLPVLARIRIRNRGDLVGRNYEAWIGHQRGMQRLFHHARLGRRCKFGTRQIGLEKLVGHHEPAARVAVEQVMPAGRPEIPHGRSVFVSAIATRSTSSATSSSPSTSRNENARIGFLSPRGCKVRKASRTSPFSNVR